MSHSNKTTIYKTKKTGIAGNATKSWWYQRITSIALIPIAIWFVITILKITKASNNEIAAMIGSPLNSVMLMIMIGIGIYHSTLGMKEIIEDYIHCKKMKFTLLIILKFVSFFTAIFGIIAVLVFHFTVFSSN